MPRVARGSATICCAQISEQADRRPHFHQVECHDDATRASLGRPGPLRLAFRLDVDWEGVLQLFRMFAAVGLLVAAATAPARAADVSGAGATFPYPLYAKWADA